MHFKVFCDEMEEAPKCRGLPLNMLNELIQYNYFSNYFCKIRAINLNSNNAKKSYFLFLSVYLKTRL